MWHGKLGLSLWPICLFFVCPLSLLHLTDLIYEVIPRVSDFQYYWYITYETEGSREQLLWEAPLTLLFIVKLFQCSIRPLPNLQYFWQFKLRSHGASSNSPCFVVFVAEFKWQCCTFYSQLFSHKEQRVWSERLDVLFILNCRRILKYCYCLVSFFF